MFGTEKATAAFERVRTQAGLTMYGADCYAYGLLASGFHDLVVEANNGIHDFLALVPVIEGAGGIITDWEGRALGLDSGDKVLAAGDPRMHAQALKLLAAEQI
jgi:fructose-1,6-bisphosphatase/inositol monophosphatase family enzyme